MKQYVPCVLMIWQAHWIGPFLAFATSHFIINESERYQENRHPNRSSKQKGRRNTSRGSYGLGETQTVDRLDTTVEYRTNAKRVYAFEGGERDRRLQGLWNDLELVTGMEAV